MDISIHRLKSMKANRLPYGGSRGWIDVADKGGGEVSIFADYALCEAIALTFDVFSADPARADRDDLIELELRAEKLMGLVEDIKCAAGTELAAMNQDPAITKIDGMDLTDE